MSLCFSSARCRADNESVVEHPVILGSHCTITRQRVKGSMSVPLKNNKKEQSASCKTKKWRPKPQIAPSKETIQARERRQGKSNSWSVSASMQGLSTQEWGKKPSRKQQRPQRPKTERRRVERQGKSTGERRWTNVPRREQTDREEQRDNPSKNTEKDEPKILNRRCE